MAKTMTPDMMDSWMDIEDATDDEYTVMEGDTGYHLRVMATYTDAVGHGVLDADHDGGRYGREMTLLERYDDGG